jgi:hypothetical protein
VLDLKEILLVASGFPSATPRNARKNKDLRVLVSFQGHARGEALQGPQRLGDLAGAFRLRSPAKGLCAGGWRQAGQGEAAFYKTLIKTADKRFDAHLKQLAKAKKASP